MQEWLSIVIGPIYNMYRIVGESIANYIHQVAQFPYADAGGMYIYRIYMQK